MPIIPSAPLSGQQQQSQGRRGPGAFPLLVALLLPFGVTAQTTTCPEARDLPPQALVGLWRAAFEDGTPAGSLLLEPHPEHAGSLAGALNRDGVRAQVAADLEDGELTLEESADGRRISATWLGMVVEGSCGREIRGQWQPREGAARPFVMRRAGGW